MSQAFYWNIKQHYSSLTFSLPRTHFSSQHQSWFSLQVLLSTNCIKMFQSPRIALKYSLSFCSLLKLIIRHLFLFFNYDPKISYLYFFLILIFILSLCPERRNNSSQGQTLYNWLGRTVARANVVNAKNRAIETKRLYSAVFNGYRRARVTKLQDKNLDLQEGLGLVNSAIIDQHFVVKSRYNRLLSALAKFPNYPCIGIDEATAIIVQGNKVTIAGDGQVIVFRNPKGLRFTREGLIKFTDLQMSIFTVGDTF